MMETEISVADAFQMAEQVLDWCDRVQKMESIVPGARAVASLIIDDVKFEFTVRCLGPAPIEHDTVADSDGDDGA